MTTPYHVPVMLNASIEALNLDGDGGARNGNWMDATFGGGGHSKAILAKLGADARLFGFDQDPRRRQMRWTTNGSRWLQPTFGLHLNSFAPTKDCH